ncbi:MAG TPA: 50S ribosomal protein L24 [Acidobacteriota bacterium]|nr:50S ribosomal protein L24 [Acidobacteriota bacterium]
MLHVKKNDTVLVTTGKDRGRTGKVLVVYPRQKRAIVEGLNMIKRHTRPNPQRNIKGGVVEREAPIHISNLRVVNPQTGEPARIGYDLLADGEKVRVDRKTGETLG